MTQALYAHMNNKIKKLKKKNPASTENRERILKFLREKKQVTYKGKPIKITADFSVET
jgi:Fe2+ or Zn2+ uptake regulation protein